MESPDYETLFKDRYDKQSDTGYVENENKRCHQFQPIVKSWLNPRQDRYHYRHHQRSELSSQRNHNNPNYPQAYRSGNNETKPRTKGKWRPSRSHQQEVENTVLKDKHALYEAAERHRKK
ncbi:hypothetical protein TrispH2_009682 [Trichoplax sp. H2]|nr:hypothetical protein TrispH2_009682 [Trichoplax sp. H2]|eukprot:RDD38642.1 hypothetical protein TrispH2_009682 [Trichoplax sp. H2]